MEVEIEQVSSNVMALRLDVGERRPMKVYLTTHEAAALVAKLQGFLDLHAGVDAAIATAVERVPSNV